MLMPQRRLVSWAIKKEAGCRGGAGHHFEERSCTHLVKKLLFDPVTSRSAPHLQGGCSGGFCCCLEGHHFSFLDLALSLCYHLSYPLLAYWSMLSRGKEGEKSAFCSEFWEDGVTNQTNLQTGREQNAS
jgi:hypothetical protein